MTRSFYHAFSQPDLDWLRQQHQPQQRIKTIDMHTGGEPLRVVLDGYPAINADSLLDYRQQLAAHHDQFRTQLMFEPRGHGDMYGCLILPPFNPQADCSVIFMHNEGYSTMCGHAVIAIMTLAMKMNWLPIIDNHAQLTIEAPCGLIKAQGQLIDGEIFTSFLCVPSFVVGIDRQIQLNQQTIHYDLAYGGAFYAYVDIQQFGLTLDPAHYFQLIALGRQIKQAVWQADNHLIQHPFEPQLSNLYGTIFIDHQPNEPGQSRNVCVFADGEVDRSPTGSGVSGRLALHYHKGEIAIGETLTIASIINSTFTAKVIETIPYGPHRAVIPQVCGQAYVCGINEWLMDSTDQLSKGFLLR